MDKDMEKRLDDLEVSMIKLQLQVEGLQNNTKEVVSAFNSAQGAFTALDWIARVVKPILLLGSLFAGAILYFKGMK